MTGAIAWIDEAWPLGARPVNIPVWNDNDLTVRVLLCGPAGLARFSALPQSCVMIVIGGDAMVGGPPPLNVAIPVGVPAAPLSKSLAELISFAHALADVVDGGGVAVLGSLGLGLFEPGTDDLLVCGFSGTVKRSRWKNNNGEVARVPLLLWELLGLHLSTGRPFRRFHRQQHLRGATETCQEDSGKVFTNAAHRLRQLLGPEIGRPVGPMQVDLAPHSVWRWSSSTLEHVIRRPSDRRPTTPAQMNDPLLLGPHVAGVHREEMGELVRWCDSSDDVSVGVLGGPTGSGKTHLAAALARDRSLRGWQAGFLRWNADPTCILDPGPARLVIVDDCHARVDQVSDLLFRVTNRTLGTRGLRILLVVGSSTLGRAIASIASECWAECQLWFDELGDSLRAAQELFGVSISLGAVPKEQITDLRTAYSVGPSEASEYDDADMMAREVVLDALRMRPATRRSFSKERARWQHHHELIGGAPHEFRLLERFLALYLPMSQPRGAIATLALATCRYSGAEALSAEMTLRAVSLCEEVDFCVSPRIIDELILTHGAYWREYTRALMFAHQTLGLDPLDTVRRHPRLALHQRGIFSFVAAAEGVHTSAIGAEITAGFIDRRSVEQIFRKARTRSLAETVLLAIPGVLQAMHYDDAQVIAECSRWFTTWGDILPKDQYSEIGRTLRSFTHH